MPTSPECQPIADQITALNAQEQAKRDSIAALAGVDKWKAMQDLGTIRQQIAEQQGLLADCEKQHSDDLTTEVVVFDLPGNSGPNRIARAWQLTSAGQAVKQTATIQNGTVTLSGILGSNRQSFGITIEGTDHPTVNGPDFRSGPLPAFLRAGEQDPAGRIEIVILSPIVISADSLEQAAPALPIQIPFPAGPAGTVTVSVTALQVTISGGNVSLTASGTASVPAAPPFSFAQTSPFTFAQTLHIAPAFGIAPGVILELLPGTAPVFSVSGLVGTVVQNIAPLLSSSLLAATAQPLMALLNKLVAGRVATVLGLPALPSGSVLSIRELTTDNDSLTITPVLGAFGTALSTFQPSPPDVVRGLISLSVQPASISSSDPAQRVAQGLVTLDGLAPAGGVSIQLSCDRPDVVAVAPATLLILEGQNTGAFTATGIPQPILPTSQIDCSVRASLGSQTLVAPLSVRPEPPPTAPPVPAAPIMPLVSSRPGIASIDLLTPPPLPRTQTVQGRVLLDGIFLANTPVTLILSPPVTPPISVLIPAGS